MTSSVARVLRAAQSASSEKSVSLSYCFKISSSAGRTVRECKRCLLYSAVHVRCQSTHCCQTSLSVNISQSVLVPLLPTCNTGGALTQWDHCNSCNSMEERDQWWQCSGVWLYCCCTNSVLWQNYMGSVPRGSEGKPPGTVEHRKGRGKDQTTCIYTSHPDLCSLTINKSLYCAKLSCLVKWILCARGFTPQVPPLLSLIPSLMRSFVSSSKRDTISSTSGGASLCSYGGNTHRIASQTVTT